MAGFKLWDIIRGTKLEKYELPSGNAVDASVLVDPTTEKPYVPGMVKDSAGNYFMPDSGAHNYTYDGNGSLLTDMCILDGVTRIKTYTWTSGKLTSETVWTVQ